MIVRNKKENIFPLSIIVLIGFIGTLLLMILYFNNLNYLTYKSQGINLWAIFLTGLFTGGLSCLAVQGGLLAATVAQREEEKLKEKTKRSGNALPIFSFLIAKLIAYSFFGFLLGWFGSLFQLSLAAQIVMQLFVVVFMLGTAFNLLNVHPIFRYFVIQPPRKFTQIIRNKSKSKSIFAPALLGAFTVFIPCGVTQAMMALSISSANPFLGLAIMFAFVLGTSPLFFILGYFTSKLGNSLHQKFMKVAALAIIILALFNLNNALELSASPWTVDKFIKKTNNIENASKNISSNESFVIEIKESGYSPSVVNVKAGSNVTFKIKNEGVYTCASAFTIPAFNYQKVVQAGKTETIVLKMPGKPTQIPFMCSMGMYKGVINVI